MSHNEAIISVVILSMKMEDLLQSQIKGSCRLAMPEGLRDLMNDISREVLRTQPADLYMFIVSYLEAMLIARESLCVACRVCRGICQCTCHPELEDELRNIGLDEEHVETAKNLVMKYFDKDEVKEGNLLMKLFYETDIDNDVLPAIQDAVRAAFQKHLRVHQAKFWADAEQANEVSQQAANHTLQYYDRLQEDKELSWDDAATKIQTAFRGEGLRVPLDEAEMKLREKLARIESSNITFEPKLKIKKDDPEKASTSRSIKNNIVRLSLSSSSLAGSMINLPKYVPYSVHDMTYVDFEERETERKNIDYTLETHFKDSKKDEGTKKIAFHDQHILHEIKSCSIEGDEEIEDKIAEYILSETVSVDENIVDDKPVDNNDEDPASAFGKDIDGVNSFIEQCIQEIVNYTNIEDNTLDGIFVDGTSVYECNSGITEGTLAQNESTTEPQEYVKKIKSYSMLGINEFEEEEEIEEYEEEENIEIKNKASSKVESKGNIEMMKTIKKKLITLSKTAIIDDYREQSLSLSSD